MKILKYELELDLLLCKLILIVVLILLNHFRATAVTLWPGLSDH